MPCFTRIKKDWLYVRVEKNHDFYLKKSKKNLIFLFKSDLFLFYFLNLVYRYLYRCLNL